MMKLLYEYLEQSAQKYGDRIAVSEPGKGDITYNELSALSKELRDALWAKGVRPGDRVAIYMPKSGDGVASIFGILKAGASYVPLDPTGPLARNAYILNNCAVKFVIAEQHLAEKLQAEPLYQEKPIEIIVLPHTGGGKGLKTALEFMERHRPDEGSVSPHTSDDTAYILYTSGSTGKPKGVVLSHENATSFVDWCSEIFDPNHEDRFSSHAPFHFDLSILDLYVSIKHGATLVLISEEISKDPISLAAFMAEQKISVWYSTPSVLSLIAQFGKLPQHDCPALRVVFFAGEVFPIKHLKLVKSLLPKPRYFNLYGPTETNVCTYYEIPRQIPEDRTNPFPIGKVCSHFQAKVVNAEGKEIKKGEEGELCINGAGVMKGYWNLPEQSAKAFLEIDDEKWYKTGDLVIEAEDGNFDYVGRKDRMIKKRGYRIELGEIETALYRFPDVKEAAAIAVTDDTNGVLVKAFMSSRNGEKPSIIQLKRFCSHNLPVYMVPDSFSFLDSLPKTSTDKINYQALKEMN